MVKTFENLIALECQQKKNCFAKMRWRQWIGPLASVILFFHSCRSLEIEPWSYECDQYNRCGKTALASQLSSVDRLGLQECLLTCQEFALFWPRPRSFEGVNKQIVEIQPSSISWVNSGYYDSVPAGEMLQQNLRDQLKWLEAKRHKGAVVRSSSNSLNIVIAMSATSTGPKASHNMAEDYSLKVTSAGGTVTANITADNFYGARHALETLFQAIDYDDVRQSYVVLSGIHIHDQPEFSHRGLSLDTVRNFMSVEVIKRILDGLAAAKMNVLHWHMVDTQSFPIELKGPLTSQMTQYGAYDPASVYSQDDMRDIINYANIRGIRIIPEFDQPAHVGVGWDFPGAENYTVCLGVEPWYDYCLQPPCGQLNPAEPRIYDQLEAIYKELYDVFKFDTFHMGADEVHMGCWNSSKEIVDYMDSKGWEPTEEGFIALWKEFQDESSARLRNASSDDVQLIVWTSDLTKRENIDNLPPDEYIVHIWTNGSDVSDETISGLVDGGYRMIFSNYETNYLDCGYGAWVGEGNNWCTPYKGWQKLYENDLYELLEMRGHDTNNQDIRDLILGGETAMWSEQVDSETVEGKVFPRTAAFAERLWSNPDSGWYEAETRMLEMRRRLVQRGIKADRLQPEWCRQNSGQCYVQANNPANPTTTTTTTTEDPLAEGEPETAGQDATRLTRTEILLAAATVALLGARR